MKTDHPTRSGRKQRFDGTAHRVCLVGVLAATILRATPAGAAAPAFGPPEPLVPGSTGHEMDNVAVARGLDGEVVVAYAYQVTPQSNDWSVRLFSLKDGVASPSEEIPRFKPGNKEPSAAVFVGDDGRQYVALQTYDTSMANPPRQIIFYERADGSHPWSAGVELSDPAAVASGPAILADGSVVHVGWAQQSSTYCGDGVYDSNAYYARRPSSGGVFAAPLEIGPQPCGFSYGAQQPVLSLAAGLTFFTWQDDTRSPDAYVIYSRSSHDQGASWDGAETLVASGYNKVFAGADDWWHHGLLRGWVGGDDPKVGTHFVELTSWNGSWQTPTRWQPDPTLGPQIAASPEGYWVATGTGGGNDIGIAVDRWTDAGPVDHADIVSASGVKRVSHRIVRDTRGVLHAFWLEYATSGGGAGTRSLMHASARLCTPSPEVCNGVDDDCDGFVDEGCADAGPTRDAGPTEGPPDAPPDATRPDAHVTPPPAPRATSRIRASGCGVTGAGSTEPYTWVPWLAVAVALLMRRDRRSMRTHPQAAAACGRLARVAGLVTFASLVAGCGPRSGGATSTVREGANTTQPPGPGDGMALGIVTGGIYDDAADPQPLATNADNAFCEFQQLGARWIRIEADWQGTDEATYQRIVSAAHAHGLLVDVLVTKYGTYSGGGLDTAAIDAFRATYVHHLDDLATRVFVGSASADAWEIVNEPNNGPISSGNAFAWLLRSVWSWKTDNGRPEIIISGGLLNTYDTEPFWIDMFGSGAWSVGPRPFDYFGVHPYDEFSYNAYCVNSGTCGGNLSDWGTRTQAELTAIAAKIDAVSNTTGSKLVATEFGFQRDPLADCSSCSAAECGTGCFASDAIAAQGMAVATQAMRDSGAVVAAFLYDYRDDLGDHPWFGGLRGAYDGGGFPVKAQWSQFASLAGGAGGNPDACWTTSPSNPPASSPPPSATVLEFDTGDRRLCSAEGDWQPDSFKAECAADQAMTGLSMSPSDRHAHAALCGSHEPSAYPHSGCHAREFDSLDSRGTVTTGDWAPNYFKGECGADEYVAGISQRPGLELTSLLCCPSPAAKHEACAPLQMDGGDAREAGTSGDWDAGYWKGECGAGRFVAGVSQQPGAAYPHSILCCD